MKTLLAILAVVILCGCTTATRVVTNKAGVITSTTKVHTFLTAVQGFDDSVAPDGTQHTILANYASDVQAMQVLANFGMNVMKFAVVASGNTNFVLDPNMYAGKLSPGP